MHCGSFVHPVTYDFQIKIRKCYISGVEVQEVFQVFHNRYFTIDTKMHVLSYNTNVYHTGIVFRCDYLFQQIGEAV